MDLDTSIALVSLDEAKEYLAIQGSEEDEIVAAIVNGVSGTVSAYLGRELVQKTYTEYYNGNGTPSLILRNYPVVSITSIHEDSLRMWQSDAAVDVAGDVQVNLSTGILTNWNNRYAWDRGRGNIKVVYVAGYTIGVTMPHVIRMATKRLADLHYREGYTHRKLDTASEAIGGATTSYVRDAIPKDVAAMLAPYRRSVTSEDFASAA
jgi:hypothetical protein